VAQVRDQLRTFEDDEAVIECIALVRLGKAAGNDTRDSFEFERGRSLFAARASAEIKSGNDNISILIQRIEIRIDRQLNFRAAALISGLLIHRDHGRAVGRVDRRLDPVGLLHPAGAGSLACGYYARTTPILAIPVNVISFFICFRFEWVG